LIIRHPGARQRAQTNQNTSLINANNVRSLYIDHTAQTRTAEPVTVLELKFERQPPAWMVALVKRLDLIRYSFSKYCDGVNAELTLPGERSPRRGGRGG
jgi:hypothetical protein